MQVTKREEEIVVCPASPSSGRGTVLPLCTLDKCMLPYHFPVMLFFKQGPVFPVAALRDSLAEALSLFYTLAGRLRESASSASCKGSDLEIVCSDDGAPFQEAWIDSSFDYLLPQCDPRPEFRLLLPALDPSVPLSHRPILAVQLTHFACGAVSLGMLFHHLVCDGASMAHFLTAWVALTRRKVYCSAPGLTLPAAAVLMNSDADALAGALKEAQIPLPHMDRAVLKQRINQPPGLCLQPFEDLPKPAGKFEKCRGKIFSFTPESIAALKQELCLAADRNGPVTSYTRFEALTAHLVLGILHARGLHPALQEINLTIRVDGRRRLRPPLAEGYFGNVVFESMGLITAERAGESLFCSVAGTVKRLIARVSDTAICQALVSSPAAFPVDFNSMDIHVGSWSTFPLYNLDFGWGNPSFVRSFWFATDGLVGLFPSPLGPGHIDALVGLPEDIMPKLETFLTTTTTTTTK